MENINKVGLHRYDRTRNIQNTCMTPLAKKATRTLTEEYIKLFRCESGHTICYKNTLPNDLLGLDSTGNY